MNATDTEHGVEAGAGAATGGLALIAGERWLAAASARDRRFLIALAATAVLHAALVIAMVRAVPRQIGDPSGADNAISVAIVTEADLKALSAVPEQGGPPPGAPASAPAQPAPLPQSQPQAKSDQPESLRQSIAEDVPEAKTTPERDDRPAPEAQSSPEAGEVPAPKKPAAKVTPPAQPKAKQSAKLDLSPPPAAANAPFGGGRSAGFERPPGITRSGANDDFARNVIRALQQTMPQLSDTFGRVTVRIVLNQNGNVTEVKVMRPSNIVGLDQSVMFAIKQTSFPFPPANSIDVDRIFQVTYVYR